jgi:hypothetical protein
VMLSQLKHFDELKHRFPGEHETDRDEIIINGEIGLSLQMIRKGKSLTCLAWPEYAFGSALPRHPEPNYLDLEVRDQPFRFKLWDNPRRGTLWARISWFLQISRSRGRLQLLRLVTRRLYMKASRVSGRLLQRHSHARKS